MLKKDSGVRARFFVQAVENPIATKEQGRPIFDDVEMVEFLIPGDPKSRPVNLAHETANSEGATYAEIFADEYSRFKRNDMKARTGTPLEQWPPMTAARVAEFKAANIFSVEDLAIVSDANMRRLGPGARELREQAKAYLEDARENAKFSAQAARIAELEAKIEALTAIKADAPSASAPEPEAPEPDDNDDLEFHPHDMYEWSDEQLKAYIKERTGEGVRGLASRATLLRRARVAQQLAQQPETAE